MNVIIKNIVRGIRIILLQLRSMIVRPLNMSNDSVLIIAPHPDDEVFGCAGLIKQCLNNGQSVNVAILTGGSKSHGNCCALDENTIIENRRNLSRKAAEILGLPSKNLFFFNYIDGGVVFGDSETNKLRVLINELQPDSIFIPHKGDGWSDHVNTGRIVKSLVAGNKSVSLYEYCVWFWYYNSWAIDWANAWLLKMTSKEHKLKLRAIDTYITPLAPCGNPWSGVLPRIFVKANRWNKELYFKVQ